MSIDTEIPTHLNMRIDPKLRYLADLAARARNKSLTDYIEDVIWESLKTVSLNQFPELSEEPDVYELSPAQRQEKFKKRQQNVPNPLSEVADSLWSEHPFVRIQLLAISGLDHLLTDKEKGIWNYVHSHRDFKKEGKLNLNLIDQKWLQIKLNSHPQANLVKEKGIK